MYLCRELTRRPVPEDRPPFGERITTFTPAGRSRKPKGRQRPAHDAGRLERTDLEGVSASEETDHEGTCIGREELLTGPAACRVSWRNATPCRSLSNILLEAKHDGRKLSRRIRNRCGDCTKPQCCSAGGVTISGAQAVRDHQGTAERRDRAHLGRNNWTYHPILARANSKSSASEQRLSRVARSITEDRRHVAGAGLLELIRKTLFAAGDSDARYILNGLLVGLTTRKRRLVVAPRRH